MTRLFDGSPEVVRLVVRYPLSPRNVEELLFGRGITSAPADQAARR